MAVAGLWPSPSSAIEAPAMGQLAEIAAPARLSCAPTEAQMHALTLALINQQRTAQASFIQDAGVLKGGVRGGIASRATDAMRRFVRRAFGIHRAACVSAVARDGRAT